MDECKLNLGPFNDCIDVVKEGVTPKYCVNGEVIQIPTKVYGLAIDSDTPENRKKLKNAIELAVINTIYEIVKSERLDIVSLLKRVKIPFVSSKFHIDHKNRLCITAIFGVAIFDDDCKSDCEEVY